MRVGLGIDYHVFEEDKPMVLGGLRLPFDYGFKAHSDGDVLLHALMDGILGALGLEDIGTYFPMTDKYKDADSKVLLAEVLEKMEDLHFGLNNMDATIIAQQPRLAPYKEKIKKRVSELTGLKETQISIKATTPEKMGAIGRREGVAVHCVVSLKALESRNQD